MTDEQKKLLAGLAPREVAEVLLALHADPDSRSRALKLAFTDLLHADNDRVGRVMRIASEAAGKPMLMFHPDYPTIVRVLVRGFRVDGEAICEVAKLTEAEFLAAVGEDDDDDDEPEEVG